MLHTCTWHMYVINAHVRDVHVRDKRAWAGAPAGTHNEMFGGTFGGQGVALPTENAATNQKVTEKQILISPC